MTIGRANQKNLSMEIIRKISKSETVWIMEKIHQNTIWIEGIIKRFKM